ncbi:hypothetical protein BH10PLA1_BH10PLA1_10030 [soil metagenome]
MANQWRNPIDRSATVVRRKPSLDFSVTGLVYCSMMMFMGLAAINNQANLLFGVFGLMIGIRLISGILSKLVLRKLYIRRILPEDAEVGLTVTVVYQFGNRKRYWPSVSVTIAELDGAEGFTKQPQSYMLHAAAQHTASVPTELLPKRRGVHELDRYQVSTSFPFGFIKRAIERGHKDSLVIFPPLATVDRHLMQMCKSAENTGSMMRPRHGGMDEFYGVKEYRRGENTRFIYWRRSARAGVLVSKEMTQVSPPRLVLVVDTHLKDESPDSFAEVERTIAMAASVASHAIKEGLLVGLVAWSGEWLILPPDRGKRHRVDLLATLARLPKNTTEPIANLLLEAQKLIEEATTGVVFTPGTLSLTLGERVRASLVVVSAISQQNRAWFAFDKDVDFYTCMPANQQPKL